MGHRQLDSVLPSEIKQWVNALRDSGLSHSRIRKSHLVLAMIFDHAVEDRHLDRSPVTRLRLRKDARLTKPMVALTIHQLPQVALAVRDSLVVGPGLSNRGYDMLVMLAADTGLRSGELRAVRRGRCHLDSDTPFVEVVESITDVWKEGVVSKDPKTHALRTVQLSPSVTVALRSHIERGLPGPDSLVFTSPGGSPVHWSNFKNRVWYPALDHVGIRRCKIYALRHTSASLLAAAGVPLHDVKVQLGHSSITTTESYLHFYPQGLEDVAVGMSLSTYKRRDLFGSWCSSYFLSEQEESRRVSKSRIDIGT